RINLVKGLILRAFHAQGDRILRDMEGALRGDDYPQVYDHWRVLNQHAKRMLDFERDFAKPANELLERGQALVARADLLEKISRFQFDISGIVAGGGVAKAIINDRVLSENDVVFDQ